MRQLLFALFFSQILFAEPDALYPRSGEYTCNRLAHKRYDCLTLIRGQFVDEWASGAIDRYTNIDETMTGMYIIVGHQYQTNAVLACDRFTQPVDTNSCLRTIADCTFSDSAVAKCDRETSTQTTNSCFRYYCNQP